MRLFVKHFPSQFGGEQDSPTLLCTDELQCVWHARCGACASFLRGGCGGSNCDLFSRA